MDGSSVHWPNKWSETDFWVLELLGVLPNDEDELSHVIFDPIPRVGGIEPSDDPLLERRAATYPTSGRRRRKSAKG